MLTKLGTALQGYKTLIAAFAIPALVQALATLSPEVAVYVGKGGPALATAFGLVFGVLRMYTRTPLGQKEVADLMAYATAIEGNLGLTDADVKKIADAITPAFAPLLAAPQPTDIKSLTSTALTLARDMGLGNAHPTVANILAQIAAATQSPPAAVATVAQPAQPAV